MYAIHTTPGFILDSRPYGDADKLITIFTRDFGLVTATALGIRHEKSKLRYYCQDYMFGVFSMVRGKEFWRLTSASSSDINSEKGGELLIARLAQLLRRLLHGEEANPELFDVIEMTVRFLNPTLTEEDLKTLESITVLRIMALLGYVGHDSMIEPYITSRELNADLLKKAAANRTVINQHINKALKESHL